MDLTHGIRANLDQFLHQLLQVLLVGFTIGMMRTVVPALAEAEFGVPKNSFLLLTAFVVAFGFVKGSLNFVAGRLSERIGRKSVLMLGWVAALPIPLLIYFAQDWNWIVAATILLGVNQGLTWSMTQTAKLDITRLEERGLTIGLNEFSGYVGVAPGGDHHRLCRHRAGCPHGPVGVRHGGGAAGDGADASLDQRHAAVGQGRGRQAQERRRRRPPPALCQGQRRPSRHLGGVHPAVLA